MHFRSSYSYGTLLALTENVRLGRKKLAVKNVLAHISSMPITAVKYFILQAQERGGRESCEAVKTELRGPQSKATSSVLNKSIA